MHEDSLYSGVFLNQLHNKGRGVSLSWTSADWALYHLPRSPGSIFFRLSVLSFLGWVLTAPCLPTYHEVQGNKVCNLKKIIF